MEKMVLKPTDTNEIRLGQFILRDKDLYMIKDSKDGKEEVYLANASKIKSVTRNIETGVITLEIEYYSFDRWETLKISKGKLLPSELSFLLDKGMDIAGYKAKHVFQFLDFHEKSFKPTYVHQKLGWMSFKMKFYFDYMKLFKIINSSLFMRGSILFNLKGARKNGKKSFERK